LPETLLPASDADRKQVWVSALYLAQSRGAISQELRKHLDARARALESLWSAMKEPWDKFGYSPKVAEAMETLKGMESGR
jgi:hypothetical protein